jgi:hypothetical protein
MNLPEPKIRIEIIERSEKCFWLGLFSLIPVLGLPLAVMSLGHNHRIRRLGAGQWNPASRYRYWGAVFARLAIALLLIAVTAITAILTMLTHWPTNG